MKRARIEFTGRLEAGGPGGTWTYLFLPKNSAAKLGARGIVPVTVTVKAHNKTFHLPIARFDNRKDKTSFLRADPDKWKKEDVAAVHDGLKGALSKLAGLSTAAV